MDGSGCEQQSETGWESRNERNTPLPFITNIPRIDKHKIHNGICRQRSKRIRTISPSPLGRCCRSVVPFLPFPLPAALFPPRSALFSFPSAILRPAPRVYSSFHSATNYIQRAEEERERDISGLYSVLRLISRQMFPLGGSKRWPFVFNAFRTPFLSRRSFFFFFLILIGIIINCVIRFEWTCRTMGSSVGFGMNYFRDRLVTFVYQFQLWVF